MLSSAPYPWRMQENFFPMHVCIPDIFMIHHCTVYNPIMIIHLFVMGLDNWSSTFTLSRFIDRLTPMTSHIWREKLPSEICILRNSKFELLKLNMCSILNKKINTNNFKYIFSFIYKKIGSRDNKPLSFYYWVKFAVWPRIHLSDYLFYANTYFWYIFLQNLRMEPDNMAVLSPVQLIEVSHGPYASWRIPPRTSM